MEDLDPFISGVRLFHPPTVLVWVLFNVVVDLTMCFVTIALMAVNDCVGWNRIRRVENAVPLAILGEGEDFSTEGVNLTGADNALEANLAPS